ncbi:peptide deformylase [Dinghuibacter silviterrae]|uniref:Peptide deformylase n=1 Tax=Dinghuibacter silviterrae TaxID=1539049 RepID=A0A4R8DGJ3_9BACT|nr:peptide deformylase [Dinghuibacter silviterrae]TDW96498.1 peptide deformylase [Dinghuibacter silviterrae]
MILPIVAYGAQILRAEAKDITPDYPDLKELLESMWETMYYSQGVGIAAPQVNKPIRIFLVDTAQVFERMDDEEKEEYDDDPGIKRVFINAHVQSLDGDEWAYNEGCLSIPKIREDVLRPEEITLSYVDENFEPHTETFSGLTARVIQHEYDHIDGKLFIDYLKPLRRKLLKAKLDDISKGKVSVDYKMTFPK